jgi:hypothetical protein
VLKDGALNYHLTGTDFYQELSNETLLASRHIWDQEFVSETNEVYRSAYLAYKLFNKLDKHILLEAGDDTLLGIVQEESRNDYAEGYVKGVHDVDATKILKVLVHKQRAGTTHLRPRN